jgi:hypothetical protein
LAIHIANTGRLEKVPGRRRAQKSTSTGLCVSISVLSFKWSCLTSSYGINSAYSKPFQTTYYQDAIEKLDKYTHGFDIPTLLHTAHGITDRLKTKVDMNEIDPEFADLDAMYNEEEYELVGYMESESEGQGELSDSDKEEHGFRSATEDFYNDGDYYVGEDND